MDIDSSSVIGAGAGIIGALTSFANNDINRNYESHEAYKQYMRNLDLMHEQNAWNYEMWEKQNEYNSPTAQRQRLLDAGLNPLYYGLDGTGNAGALTSAQALGYTRGSVGQTPNPIMEGINAYTAVRSMQKDIELKNAQIDKLKEDTVGVGLDNQWKDRTLDARVQSEDLANNLTKEQTENVKEERKNIMQTLNNLKEQAKTEQEKQLYVQAETAVQKATEKEIVSLLPYRVLLTEAQTESEKADAALKWTQKAYQQKLIDDGYVDAMVENMQHEAAISGVKIDSAEAEKALTEFKAAVRSGTAIGPKSTLFGKGLAILGNTFLRTTSQLSEAMGGNLTGLVGAGLLGKGVSKAGAAAAGAKGKYQNPYEDDFHFTNPTYSNPTSTNYFPYQ